MRTIGFVGLGSMGAPMSANLAVAGYRVRGFDLAGDVRQAAAERGVEVTGSAADGADFFITMLPNGAIVRDVLTGSGGALERLPAGALLIDSSSIDVATTRDLHAAGTGHRGLPRTGVRPHGRPERPAQRGRARLLAARAERRGRRDHPVERAGAAGRDEDCAGPRAG
jgi:NAD binding domain of 6-phosphogluconate dehydrogenase